jgi:formylmethanofuran dehydrogenase subunit B
MKIVINSCYGGFSISQKCAELMSEMGNEQARAELEEFEQENNWIMEFLKTGAWPVDCPKSSISSLMINAKYLRKSKFYGYGYTRKFNDGYSRTSPELIKAVEILGKEANGDAACLKIVNIPDDIKWQLKVYDGKEWINEEHRTWD